jgi:hypothetical protein
LFKISECDRSHERNDAVSSDPESIHPLGKPMSHATNRGFKRRVDFEDSSPSFAVAWTGREGELRFGMSLSR